MTVKLIHLKIEDFDSLEKFEKALLNLSSPVANVNEHARRQEIANEVIETLKSLEYLDRVAYINKAIVSPVFSSRHLGAIKRGLNSFFQRKSVQDNTSPYFRSSSQEMLLNYRQECAKDTSQLIKSYKSIR